MNKDTQEERIAEIGRRARDLWINGVLDYAEGYKQLVTKDIPCLLALLSERDREIARKDAALEACEETLRLVERVPQEDPEYGVEIYNLGVRVGFGALMTSAQAGWREALEAEGYPVGGEFVAGPCHATVVSLLETVRAALSTPVQPLSADKELKNDQ